MHGKQTISEQRIIVAELNGLDNEIALTEGMVRDMQNRSAALRRSIFADAFSGQLVAQEPSDELASALLERSAAERAASKPSRKTKSGSRRANSQDSQARSSFDFMSDASSAIRRLAQAARE